MRNTGQWIMLYALGRRIAERYAVRHFLSKLAITIACAVAVGILTGAAAVCALYAVYLLLGDYGIHERAALLSVAAAAAAFAGALLLLVLHHIRSAFHAFHGVERVVTDKLRPVAESFIDGLLAGSRKG